MSTVRTTILLAGIAGLTGVLAGSFGAHGLRAKLSPEMLEVFETGARYHLIHAVALLALGGFMAASSRSTILNWTAWLFALGIIVFSGSLYALAITGHKWLGMITPLGGSMFIIGWLCVIVFAIRAAPSMSRT